MDFMKVLKRNQNIAIGVGAGVVLAPTISQQVSDMFQFGAYEGAIVNLGIAAGTLAAFGKSKPEMATAFASIFLAYGVMALVPQLQF